eukprot:gnl/Dysnectes_brevis/662_a730_5590.p1 GENE.gnl/Dysnectes_brevis/662_a730_5590~~gnl/Dysnectes_brevis/662_a730_5590.p1  ORF type:complete len:249 (-),score=41.17 gnl/Dysnectes_brevis/662_a730_5590:79-792(-)
MAPSLLFPGKRTDSYLKKSEVRITSIKEARELAKLAMSKASSRSLVYKPKSSSNTTKRKLVLTRTIDLPQSQLSLNQVPPTPKLSAKELPKEPITHKPEFKRLRRLNPLVIPSQPESDTPTGLSSFRIIDTQLSTPNTASLTLRKRQQSAREDRLASLSMDFPETQLDTPVCGLDIVDGHDETLSQIVPGGMFQSQGVYDAMDSGLQTRSEWDTTRGLTSKVDLSSRVGDAGPFRGR